MPIPGVTEKAAKEALKKLRKKIQKKKPPRQPRQQFPTGPEAAGVHFKPVRRVIDITEQ